MDPIYTTIEELRRTGETGVFVVVTAVDGHAPQVVGAKMLVLPDGSIRGTIGGGKVEHTVIQSALDALDKGAIKNETYQLKTDLGMCCGGQMQVYMEPILPTPRLLLFGAGHVAQPTAALAANCGFEVHVIDERTDWNTPDRFPDAHGRETMPHGDYFAKTEFRPTDYVVVITHNHDHDREILRDALATEVGYIGMIGSTRKVQKTLRQLSLEGISETDLQRAHAPIGLDIHAETPEEIAVSIVGELIRFRRVARSQKTTRGAAVSLLAETQPSIQAAETPHDEDVEKTPSTQETRGQK